MDVDEGVKVSHQLDRGPLHQGTKRLSIRLRKRTSMVCQSSALLTEMAMTSRQCRSIPQSTLRRMVAGTNEFDVSFHLPEGRSRAKKPGGMFERDQPLQPECHPSLIPAATCSQPIASHSVVRTLSSPANWQWAPDMRGHRRTRHRGKRPGRQA